MAATSSLLPLVVPTLVAGLCGCASAVVASLLVGRNERRRFARESRARLAELQHGFALQYAQLGSTAPDEAAWVGRQFAGAYLHLPEAGERVFVPLGTRAVVGRDRAATIHLDDPAVSRTHALIEGGERDFWVTDLHSASGTRLNGRPLAAPTRLADGDELGFGGSRAVFRLLTRHG